MAGRPKTRNRVQPRGEIRSDYAHKDLFILPLEQLILVFENDKESNERRQAAELELRRRNSRDQTS